MSDEEKQVALLPYADFTMKDLESIEKFKEKGMIGLHTLKDTDVERCMALYMDGKSYRQISNVLKIEKRVILFLASKFKWFELKRDYLDELHATLKDKVMESKLQSQEFLLHLGLAYQKKIGRDVDRFLRTDDIKAFEEIDGRDIASLLKITELLHKLNSEDYGTPQNEKSLVSLGGLGEGMNITRTGANSVEITPKSPFSNKLKQFADLKREQEKASAPPPKPAHDIVVEQPLTEKEPKNENDTK